MNVAVIINPVAGASKQRAELRHTITRLRAAGHHIYTQTTAGPGDAQDQAKQAAKGADAIMVVGGDGTAREVAQGLVGTKAAMLIWPTGTENLVAKSLGFRPDADLILACLSNGQIRPVDLGVANGRSFLLLAGVGFDAEVVHRLARTRSGHISHFSYTEPLWRTFWEHRFPVIRVICKDRVYWQGRGMVFIANLPKYALGLDVVRDARGDDGLLDLCILPCRGKIQLIGHALRTMWRTHIEHRTARYERVKQVRVESDACVPVQLDGDPAGELPIEMSIQPAAIRVMVPPGHWKG